MAKSKRPSAKTGDTIDGDAIEKPVDQTAPPHASASKHSQTAPPPSGLSSGPSSNAGSLITFAALALSVFAIGLASFAIWQQRQNTANIAALMPVSNGDAGESTDIANSDLADRLAALESQLAADRQSQQAADATAPEARRPRTHLCPGGAAAHRALCARRPGPNVLFRLELP